MTREKLRELFPKASEEFIRLNSTAPAPTPAVLPLPRARKPATAKGRQPASRPRAPRVTLTRNGGTWSEAKYWAAVRSAFRRGFRFWRPLAQAAHRARVAAPGPRGRKWLFLCAACGKLHLRRNVQVDHVVPCGELTRPEHLAPFLARLTAERPEDFQVLCLPCHQLKTQKEKQP